MNHAKHTFDADNFTNYEITIKTSEKNKIIVTISRDIADGIDGIHGIHGIHEIDGLDTIFDTFILENKSEYIFNYFNAECNKIIIHCWSDIMDYTINLVEKNIRIKQIYVSKNLQHTFLQDLILKYNLKTYDNDHEPAIFYGLMSDNDIDVLEKNKSLKIVVWVGGDINFIIHRSPNISEQIKKRIERIMAIDKIRHISISSFITKSLSDLNVKFKIIPFIGNILFQYKPVVKGPCIYLYTSPGCEQYYGSRYYIKLMKKYKNIQFIVTCHYEKYRNLIIKKKELKYGIKYYNKRHLINNIYPQCFIGLRLTDHDGLAATVQELGMMGIKSIHNGNTPSSLNYKTYEDICNHIDEEIKTIGTIDEELSNAVKKYLTIEPEFFTTKFHQEN